MEVTYPSGKDLPLNNNNNNNKDNSTNSCAVVETSLFAPNTSLHLPLPLTLATSPRWSFPRDLGLNSCSATPSPSPSPSPSDLSLSPSPSPRQEKMIRYKECQKNHAAHLGSHVVDGCGEFMPAGTRGTPLSLRCAACDCHRNFHRREVDGETTTPTTTAPPPPLLLNPPTAATTPASNCYISFNKQPPPPPRKLTPSIPARQLQQDTSLATQCGNSSNNNATRHAPVMMAFGGGGGTAAESSSEDLNAYQAVEMGGQLMMEQYGLSKKRFRTKFTQEQKEKMAEFADKIGWKMLKQDEEQVQQLCRDVGIKRQVFKVWMHNNKQALKRKQQP